MPSPIIILTSRSTVRQSGESFQVTGDDPETGQRKTLLETEARKTECIIIVGPSHATGDAMQLAIQHGVDLSYISVGGKLLARLTGPSSLTADLRLAQYALYNDPGTRLDKARMIVAAKANSALAVLTDYRDNLTEPAAVEAVDSARKALRQSLTGIPTAADRDSLMGHEGAAAAAYFGALRYIFRRGIPFEGRRTRPAPDPANALLSFGYTILGSRMAGWLDARGFDPAVGFFHETRSGRPSLALDMIEELRHPVVDRFVIRACNLGIFDPEDFQSDGEGGTRMKRETLREFFQEWERWLHTPMREHKSDERPTPLEIMRRQAERLAASVRHGEPYQPFIFGD